MSRYSSRKKHKKRLLSNSLECTEVYLCICDIEGASDQCCTGCWCTPPYNSITVWCTGSPKIHVEFAFRLSDNTLRAVRVVNGGRVTFEDNKQYSKEGWDFWALAVSERKKQLAYEFSMSKIDLPFNFLGFLCNRLCVYSGGGSSYTCCELAMETFHAMGLYKDKLAAAAYPGLFMTLIEEDQKNNQDGDIFCGISNIRVYVDNGVQF